MHGTKCENFWISISVTLLQTQGEIVIPDTKVFHSDTTFYSRSKNKHEWEREREKEKERDSKGLYTNPGLADAKRHTSATDRFVLTSNTN